MRFLFVCALRVVIGFTPPPPPPPPPTKISFAMVHFVCSTNRMSRNPLAWHPVELIYISHDNAFTVFNSSQVGPR